VSRKDILRLGSEGGDDDPAKDDDLEDDEEDEHRDGDRDDEPSERPVSDDRREQTGT